jgi:hypothetical protein
MAYSPCDFGPHPNPKRNIYTYVTFASGLSTNRRRYRVCEGHWREIEPRLSEYEVDITDPAGSFSLADVDCASCGEPILQDRAQVFVTSYPSQDYRKDYWLPIHGHHGTVAWLVPD